jgi:hypothetical protein
MTSHVITGWLRALNMMLKKQNLDILIFVKNAVRHLHMKLSTIRISWVLPNTHGPEIINYVKLNYRELNLKFRDDGI